MCGISGLITTQKITDHDIQTIQRMNTIQKHRGPDDEGLFSNEHCVLGHRRLAIIDLSKAGHQPFSSDDGRYQLIYNGEIYNYIELREELKAAGQEFRTQTDTEVLLKAYLQYGEGCLSKFNGMFAFVIYDTKENSLFLARDRFGVKPLYYLNKNPQFFFASEIKAFKAVEGIKFQANDQAVFDYLVFNRTDIFEETFFKEVQRIPKGHKAVWKNGNLNVSCWWNPEDYLNKHLDDSLETVLKTVRDLLISSVQLRLRSDVRVGSCLSGGLDSTILTGILYEHFKPKDYLTFTATFPGYLFDETKYVDMFSKKYPFTNRRTYPRPQEAYNRLKDFVYTNDEPTATTSFYSQYELMRLAKESGITVLLDGQGGDESFAGYHYLHGFALYGLWQKRRYGRFLLNLADIIRRNQHKTAYQTLIFQMLNVPQRKALLKKTVPFIKNDFFDWHMGRSKIFSEFFNAQGLNVSLVRHFQYKLEHLLRAEDRNSMAFSIEARVPYLDYRLVEYLLGVDENLKIHRGETKYLQKQALGRYTISEILNRRDKLGFTTPVKQWMESPSWKELTERNFSKLKRTLPQIIGQDTPLPVNPAFHWKINQLAVWQQVFLE